MKFLKHIFYLTAVPTFILLTSLTPVENNEDETIQWISWEEASELIANEKSPKKVFVDVYTDWCGWCKVMDKKTFNHPEVAKYMNEKYYMVKFNAEQKEDIQYKGVTFKFVPSGRRGYHELAAALLQNKLSYPSTVFLDEKMAIMSVVPGFVKAGEFYTIAKYFGDNEFKEKGWEDFQKDYKVPFDATSDTK
ncbi:MAG: DUF255 domain-containing protein [Bacteroidota bacterium]